MAFRRCLAVMSILLTMHVFGQSEGEAGDMEVLLEQLMEEMAEQFGEDFDYSELTERLHHYLKNPIDLNRTDGRDLQALGFVSAWQIRNLLAHRRESGDFISVYELQAVEGMDMNTLRFLLPFVAVYDKTEWLHANLRAYFQEGEHDLMLRYGRSMPLARGYRIADSSGRSRYLGSPDRYFVRYRYAFRDKVQFSINMKKDAGERFFGGAQAQGFDFYSASLYLRQLGNWQKIVIGDFGLQFGQGLGIWTGMAFGKGSMLQMMARQEQGLRPYTSSNEYFYLRGLAATYVKGRISFTPFVSYKPMTATMQDSVNGMRSFSSISQTGLHRTPSEAANRNSLRQWLYGANTLYRGRYFQLGATYYHMEFDGFWQPTDRLYNRFAFAGSRSDQTSLYYDFNAGNAYVYGEGAYQWGRGFAYLNGAIFSLSHQLSALVFHRHYQKEYDVLYNQAIAEGSEASNERGFYSGLSFQPHRQLEWVAYADHFSFPWLRYRVDAPSNGLDLFTQLTYSPQRTTRILLRYRYRDKAENEGGESAFDALQSVKRQQMRLDLQYRGNDAWRFRNRVEYILYDKGGDREKGYMVYQDVFYQLYKTRLSFNGRIGYFNTSGYNTRIYAFENDVLYAYSFPQYSGKGIRYYMNARWKIAKGLDAWIRYAGFTYRDRDTIGSGLDEIQGNRRSEVKVQLRCQL
ncbi:helix-hairpin-helix domain-containing protein [Olivibacter sitiensis]|uniref:helix-hairpin-helix domain-containing protein n=1 Tax=Olivibacter sitiensis TaxID=376470 RepID=UPI0004802854|nr:helix-hairpin-helix domain-containing protein [Olivibacter sitiensis]